MGTYLKSLVHFIHIKYIYNFKQYLLRQLYSLFYIYLHILPCMIGILKKTKEFNIQNVFYLRCRLFIITNTNKHLLFKISIP